MAGMIPKGMGKTLVESFHQHCMGVPFSHSGSPSLVQAPQAQRGDFVDTPAELLQKVASFLPVADKSRMSRSCKVARDALVGQLPIARAVRDASGVQTLVEFDNSLKQINRLSPGDRVEPLRLLMRRIHAMGLIIHQDSALTSWRAAVNKLPADDRLAEPPRLEHILRHWEASSAVHAGEKVGHVITCFDVTDYEKIQDLEEDAAECREPHSAGRAVDNGENVQLVAQQHGFTTPYGIVALESVAIYSALVRAALDNGENTQSLAARRGITTAHSMDSLEWMALDSEFVLRALANGENVRLVAARQGITTDFGIQELEVLAVRVGWAGQAVINGENVRHVAAQQGITTDSAIEALEERAVRDGWAGQAVINGENVRHVAAQQGITTDCVVEDLEVLAACKGRAGRLVANGENVLLVAAQQGITTDVGIGALERIVAGDYFEPEQGTAFGDIANGENVQLVYERYGFTTTDIRKWLEYAAVKAQGPHSARQALVDGGDVHDVARQYGITTEPGINQLIRLSQKIETMRFWRGREWIYEAVTGQHPFNSL